MVVDRPMSGFGDAAFAGQHKLARIAAVRLSMPILRRSH